MKKLENSLIKLGIGGKTRFVFCTGSTTLVTTLILCALCVSKDKLEIMFQKIARNKVSRKD